MLLLEKKTHCKSEFKDDLVTTESHLLYILQKFKMIDKSHLLYNISLSISQTYIIYCI